MVGPTPSKPQWSVAWETERPSPGLSCVRLNLLGGHLTCYLQSTEGAPGESPSPPPWNPQSPQVLDAGESPLAVILCKAPLLFTEDVLLPRDAWVAPATTPPDLLKGSQGASGTPL